MDYKNRCEDCANLVEKNGVWCCDECFGQTCESVDDCPCGVTGTEVAEMSEKAKTITRYEKAKETKKKAPRERKIDNEKLEILQIIEQALVDNDYYPTIEKEVAIHFNNYTLKLTRHRTKK